MTNSIAQYLETKQPFEATSMHIIKLTFSNLFDLLKQENGAKDLRNPLLTPFFSLIHKAKIAQVC